MDNYNFFSKKKEITEKKKMIKILNKYVDYLTKYSTENGLYFEFIDMLVCLYRNGKFNDYKELQSVIKGIGEFKMKKNEEGKIECEGLFKNEFINEEVKPLFNAIKEVSDYCDEIKLPSNITFEGKGIEDNLIASNMKIMKDISTPKSRVRMKGLGEMDADELWDTTMNPETRFLIKVTVEDAEKADEVLEDLLNGNTKYADKRKSFILKNQSLANNIDV